MSHFKMKMYFFFWQFTHKFLTSILHWRFMFLSTFVCFGYLNLIRPYLGNLHMTDVEKYHLIRSTLAARISQKSIQYSLSYLLYSCCCSCCCKIHLHVLMPIYFARKGNYFKSRRFISKPQAIILLVNLLE